MNKRLRTLAVLVYSGGLAVGLAGCGSRAPGEPEPVAAVKAPPPRGKKAVARAKSPQSKRATDAGQEPIVAKPAASPGKKPLQTVVAAKPVDPENRPAPKAKEEKALTGGFVLPDDPGGKLLATLLPPHRLAPPVSTGFARGPRRLAGLRSLEEPTLPVPPNLSALPRPRLEPAARPVRPRGLTTDLPLGWYRSGPETPQRPELPAAARVRLPSVDVNRPVELPILALAQPDRAPPTDPTFDASLAAAIAATVPPRTSPAPFLRLTLPDPFEHRQAVQLREPPREDAVPLNQGSSRQGQ